MRAWSFHRVDIDRPYATLVHEIWLYITPFRTRQEGYLSCGYGGAFIGWEGLRISEWKLTMLAPAYRKILIANVSVLRFQTTTISSREKCFHLTALVRCNNNPFLGKYFPKDWSTPTGAVPNKFSLPDQLMQCMIFTWLLLLGVKKL